MATTTAAAFRRFSKNLMLTDEQKKLVALRTHLLAKRLDRRFPTDANLSVFDTKLIGSAERGTLIRPPDDLDLFAVFFDVDWPHWKGDSQRFLYRVKKGLDSEGATIVGSKGQAVRISYVSGPKVDVAPAFPYPAGGFVIPDGTGGWLRTNPFVHRQFISRADLRLSGRLKPFVRKLKAWNRAHSLRLKSFHLELMVADIFDSMDGDSRQASEWFFDLAPSFLEVAKDPAGYSDPSDGFSSVRRKEIIQSFRTTHKRVLLALEAEAKGDHERAIRIWRWIYGKSFPARG